MKVAIRADASHEMGTGHLRRCLSIADALTDLGAAPSFVIRRHDNVAAQVMAATPYPVAWLPPVEEPLVPATGDVPHAAWGKASAGRDAAETAALFADATPEWVVVDHYAFGADWHRAVRAALGCRILSIDDLGDRALAPDLLLDANAAVSHTEKYAGRLPAKTRMLAGPRFAPLARAYRTAARYTFSPDVRSVGIFMGGTDTDGASAKVLRALRQDAGFVGAVEIASTSANPYLDVLRVCCACDADTTLTLDSSDLSDFYARHDLQIGAGGTSSYERCCIGVPTVAMILAANQLAVVPILAELGVVRGATLDTVSATTLLSDAAGVGLVIGALLADPDQRRALAEDARQLVDGRGAERVALAILSDLLTVRPATLYDAAMLHGWRNDAATRAVSIGTGEIALADHLRWLKAAIAAPDRTLLVAVVGTLAVGAIRFDRLDDDTWEVSLYIDPGLHGLGLGSRMLRVGEAELVRTARRAAMFHAQIVPGNEVSTKMFERAGYQGGNGRFVKTVTWEISA